MLAKRSKMTMLCAIALVAVLGASGCTSSDEAEKNPSATTSKEQEEAQSRQAAQDEILAEIDGFDFSKATNECALFEDMRSLNVLTGQLEPASVEKDLSGRLTQTQVIFTKLAELSEQPAEVKTWQKIVDTSKQANEVLGSYGGAIANDEVLTALGELALAYEEAADQHGQAIESRCSVSPDEIFVGG